MNRSTESCSTAKYDRRAKIAAVFAGLSLVGGILEAGDKAAPASAKAESAQAYESMPTQEYLTQVEDKILELQKQLRSNPGAHRERTTPNKHFYAYILQGPSVKNPSHHDKFAMGYYKDGNYPAFTELLIDAEANPGGRIVNKPGALYMIEQLNPGTEKVDRNFVTLTVVSPGKTKVYTVSNNADGVARLMNGNGAVSYDSNPGAVTKQFDAMFKNADRVINSSR